MATQPRSLISVYREALASRHYARRSIGTSERWLRRSSAFTRCDTRGRWAAERALTPAVIQRKISQGVQSADGAICRSRFLTVTTSQRQHSRDVWDFLEQAWIAHHHGGVMPSLLPDPLIRQHRSLLLDPLAMSHQSFTAAVCVPTPELLQENL